jgi:hypothetical protein
LNQTVNLRPKTTINDKQTNTKSRQNMLREPKMAKAFERNSTQSQSSTKNIRAKPNT